MLWYEHERMPADNFTEFISTYYNACRSINPNIEAIAGKWEREDLIPGLSDFDARFICRSGTTREQFCQMSQDVGVVHLDLCREYPQWARILEHLPGVNPLWHELTEEKYYFPEYCQWTFYHTADEEKLRTSTLHLENREFDAQDERFHLLKFSGYYGFYNKDLDRPVNVAPFQNKYTLHSRIMHYFSPPVQSAMSVITRRTIRGKKEAFRLALEMYGLSVFKEVLHAVDCHYEVDRLYNEQKQFDLLMKDTLDFLFKRVCEHVTIISPCADVAEMKRRLKDASAGSPVARFIESSKFCRLLRGRLEFYANAPEHFESDFLIKNELSRAADMYYRKPYGIFWREWKKEDRAPDDFISELVPDIITAHQRDAVLAFTELCTQDISGREKSVSARAAELFDDVFIGLDNVRAALEMIS